MKKSLVIIFSLAIISYIVYNNFFKKEITKIGFVAGLSGKYSNLGHSVLDGFNLAFSDINYKINGNKIEIDIKDDMQKDDVAKGIIDNFAKHNIHLIVGNTTSSMTKASLSRLSKYENTFMISPSASSSEFSDKDDNFFRVQVAHSKDRFNLLSKYLLDNNFKNLYMIYDSKNKSYSNNYLHNLKDSLKSFAGKDFVGITPISRDYEYILNDIKNKKELDAIIIVANSLDTSKLVQFLRVNNIDKQLIASGWSKNENFLKDAGDTANGIIFLTSYDSYSKEKDYLDFVKKFESKYGYTPSVFSAQGYETGKIIIKILKKDSNILNFKNNLLQQKVFRGLQGNIIFNQYGDVQRETFIVKVINNKFEKIDYTLE